MAIETSQGIPLVDENDGDKAEAVNAALRIVNALIEALAEQSGADKASLTEDNILLGVQSFRRARLEQIEGGRPNPAGINHNYDCGQAPILRIGDSADASPITITGMAGGVDGLRKMLWNVSAGTMSFLGENTGSLVGNRFRLPVAQVDIPSQGFAEFLYDNYSARWRLISAT